MGSEMCIRDREYASVAWEVTCDGACIADGVLEGAAMPDILPHGEAAVRLDFQVPEAGKCFLKLRYIRRESTRLTEAGTELGFDEILLKNEDGRNQTALRMLERCGKACADRNQSSPFTVKEDDRRLFVSGPNFAHVYNKLTGVLEEMNVNQCRLLERPVEYNIWRAPTDNDRYIKLKWQKAHYDITYSRAYQTDYSVTAEGVRIHSVLAILSPVIQRILNMEAEWLIGADGRVDVNLNVKRDTELPELPRFGLRLFLPKDMEDVTYYGLGPVESYCDKRRASSHGTFTAHVTELHEDYILSLIHISEPTRP